MSDEICLMVTTTEPCRLDVYLNSCFEELSRSKFKTWCMEGLISVNGVVRKASHQVSFGDCIRFCLPQDPTQHEIIPEDLPLDVVFEDAHIVVINKPAGMVVHPGAGVHSGTLVHALMYHFGSLSRLGGDMRPGLVHRLDRGTSGLILVAKTDPAHADLAQQWQDRRVTKVYQALVWGHPEPERDSMTTHLGRDPRDRKRMAAEVAGGKIAVSRYKTVARFPEASQLNVQILTGRTHQIRVHLSHLGHPVVGDALYGGRTHQAMAKRFSAMPSWPMLHAGLLRFRHPGDQTERTFKIEPPDAFHRCVNALSRFPYTDIDSRS